MGVQYGQCNVLRYSCTRDYSTYAGPLCQSVCGRVIDERVGRLVLAVLEPAALELSLAAAADLDKERRRLDAHWRQRLERARYEADRAARQYHAVEPENRLVARALEKRWEQAMAEQRGVEEEHDRFLRAQPTPPGEEQIRALRGLSEDVPALWHSAAATAADRQAIVRHLVERVVLTAPPDSEVADVEVYWAGGYVSRHEVVRPVARYEQMRDYPRLSQRVAELRGQELTSAQIAERLNAEGFRPPKRRATFNAGIVRSIFYRRHEAGARPAAYDLADGEWWFTDLARELRLPHPTLYSWIRRGWVDARRVPTPGLARWVLWADDDELQRLRTLRDCPRSWHCRPQAADLTKPKPRSGLSGT
jgi:hypothetical protein